jgi:hypothetical protein
MGGMLNLVVEVAWWLELLVGPITGWFGKLGAWKLTLLGSKDYISSASLYEHFEIQMDLCEFSFNFNGWILVNT